MFRIAPRFNKKWSKLTWLPKCNVSSILCLDVYERKIKRLESKLFRYTENMAVKKIKHHITTTTTIIKSPHASHITTSPHHPSPHHTSPHHRLTTIIKCNIELMGADRIVMVASGLCLQSWLTQFHCDLRGIARRRLQLAVELRRRADVWRILEVRNRTKPLLSQSGSSKFVWCG